MNPIPNIRAVVPNFADKRGVITDLLCQACDVVTLVTSQAGSERGHHYHLTSTQWIYLLSGEMVVKVKAPDGSIVSGTMKAGDLYENPPMEAHVLVAVVDSVFLSMTKGPKQQNGDTVKERVE